jgi:DNA-binding transcriptional ArsR family regulator
LLADAPLAPPAPADRVFRALGDPTRRAMLERLSEGPAAAKQLQALLGITLTAVIQHVGVLEDSGLVRSEKVGRRLQVRVRPTGSRSAARCGNVAWTGWARCWTKRTTRLDPQTLRRFLG